MTILWRLFNRAVFSGEGGGGADAGAAAAAATTTADAGASAAGEAAATGVTTTIVGEAAKADATTTVDTKADAGVDNKADTSKAAADSKDSKAADTPIEYTDFTLPDGVDVDTPTLDAAKALFVEAKLPQDVAQKYVDFYTEQTKKMGDTLVQNWVRTNEKWVSDFKADKEIGGERQTETLASVKQAVRKFGTPALQDALIATGAGNHPEFIRFFARVGKATGESAHIPAGQGAGSVQAVASQLYPTMQTKE